MLCYGFSKGSNMVKLFDICVLGAGSWGTALARLLACKGHQVRIWAYEKKVAIGINKNHQNPVYLKKVRLPGNLTSTNDLGEAINGSKFIVSVVPSHTIRGVFKSAKKFIPSDAVIVSCSKGIETTTGKRVSEILKDVLPNMAPSQFTYLSGPSFAIEVARDLPTSVVIAGTSKKNTRKVQEAFRTDRFLTFTHHDVVGVELGGALKNVIAIASGISDGLGFGLNSRATILTRALYEMIKIGRALGANPLTFTGLSGMGDLILTCTSTNSRNYSLGYQIGRGKKLKAILEKMEMVAEGVKTTKAIYKLIRKKNIHAPICEEMYNILYKNKSPQRAAEDLTSMKLREELGEII